MTVVHVIIVVIFCLDAYGWKVADLRLRPIPRARLWRLLLAIFIVGNALLLLTRLLPPEWSRAINEHIPRILISGQYLWHLAVLPVTIVCWFASRAIARGLTAFRKAPSPAPVNEVPPKTTPPVMSRRQVLSAATVALPPLALAGMTAVSFRQLGGYRVRSLDLIIPTLPPKLEGVTIAHLSDFHAGQFMTRPMMAEIVDRVNDMRPDLVFITGDLIDYALIDLPPALEALRRLKPKYGLKDGLAMCMGNHDAIENRVAFRAQSASAGFPILVNSERRIEVNGEPLQILAVDWCRTDAMTDDALCRTVMAHRDPSAYPILLAHHPHAFDQAARLGLPLTLSGHTHGGQIMFSRNIGVGALKFRYLSGIYRKSDGSQLVVSNGIGNWFPLRVNAPAEVLKLTLHRG
jgi:predicted MPP superfamily phosphohydrolase